MKIIRTRSSGLAALGQRGVSSLRCGPRRLTAAGTRTVRGSSTGEASFARQAPAPLNKLLAAPVNHQVPEQQADREAPLGAAASTAQRSVSCSTAMSTPSVAARPVHQWIVTPPWPPPPLVSYPFSEPMAASNVWLQLDRIRLVQNEGRALFPGPLANQNQLWREASNFVRQARAYWEGAQSTEGSSASLLYYYAFLNLAKAELLITDTAHVDGVRIGHGLSYNPTNAQSISGDSLRVVDGVFPRLYRKRTGLTLPNGTQLSVTRLMALIPEISLELEQSNLGTPTTEVGYHAIPSDGTSAWVLIAAYGHRFLSDSRHAATRHIARHFDQFEVDSEPTFSDWRKIFALSTRLATSLKLLQSKATFSLTAPDGSSQPDRQAAALHLRNVAPNLVEESLNFPADCLFSPGLYKSRLLPMPSSLARYALIFYASSLVRYKPSALDPVRQGEAAWLLDSLTRETPLRLLANAAGGLLGRSLIFEPNAYRV